MPEFRMKVAPDTVAYADGENHKLVVEFAIPGAPTDTIDVKILEDSVHLTAPARDIEYVAALALGWPVKPDKAEATYEHGLLRIEVPFKDPMEDAVKVAIKAGGAETKTKTIAAGGGPSAPGAAVASHQLANRPSALNHAHARGMQYWQVRSFTKETFDDIFSNDGRRPRGAAIGFVVSLFLRTMSLQTRLIALVAVLLVALPVSGAIIYGVM